MPGTKTPWVGTNSSVNCTVAKQGCIPLTALDVTAANLLKTYVPLPNAPTVSAPGNYVGNFVTRRTRMSIWANTAGFGRQGQHVSELLLPAYNSGRIRRRQHSYSINNSFATQQNANISDVHTFGATTANQVWLNFTRVAGGRVNTPTPGLAWGSGIELYNPGPKRSSTASSSELLQPPAVHWLVRWRYQFLWSA